MTDVNELGVPDTPFARAYRAAEETRAAKERAKARKLEEAIASDPEAHFYDPALDAADRPADRRMYEGKSGGLLYRLPGSEHHAADLEDWEIVPRSKKPTPLETPWEELEPRLRAEGKL